MLIIRYFNLLTIITFVIVGLRVSDGHAEKLTPYQIMMHMQIKLEKGVSQKVLSGFRAIVQRLDLDGNGQLNLEEYGKNPHFRGNPRGTRGFFGAADINGDGEMSLNEYAWQRIITDEARKLLFTMDNKTFLCADIAPNLFNLLLFVSGRFNHCFNILPPLAEIVLSKISIRVP